MRDGNPSHATWQPKKRLDCQFDGVVDDDHGKAAIGVRILADEQVPVG
jgi:hypothetical protein